MAKINKMQAESSSPIKSRYKLSTIQIYTSDLRPHDFRAHSLLISRIPRRLSSPKKALSTDLKKPKETFLYHLPQIETSPYTPSKTVSGEIFPSIYSYLPARSLHSRRLSIRNSRITRRSQTSNTPRADLRQSFEQFSEKYLEDILNISQIR
jgi:hypothetical protein